MAALRLEAKVQFPGLGKEDTPEPLVIPGGGLARRLLAACQDRGMQVLARDGHLFHLPSSFNPTGSLPCDCLDPGLGPAQVLCRGRQHPGRHTGQAVAICACAS